MAKSIKRSGFQLSVLAAALCLSAAGAYAAGLGKITILSPLGQPLRAEIDVNASSEEMVSMNARLASPEAFRQVGIEYAPGVSGIRFALEKRKDGQPYLRMTSDRPVNEPFLDVLVELTWSSGRMVREYTVLLDPPEGLAPVASTPVTVPETRKTTAAPKQVATAPVVATPAPAPVAAPQRVAPAKTEAVAKPSEDTDGRLIRSGDTLSKIAAATKPDGVSLDQMLVALFRGNQEAFDAGNMNRLRAGKILTIPSVETVTAITPAEAREVIVAQSRDFNAYRSKLAASVAATPAKDDVAKQQDQGKIAPKVADKPAAAEPPKDKLAVSRTESAKEAKAIQGRITALEEDLVARDRALKEANSRVAELERNLADLKKLAEMKSQAGAQLQQQAAAPKAPVDAKPAIPESVVAKPVEPTPVAPQEAPKVEEVPKAVEPVTAPPVVDPPKPAEAPAETKPPVPAVEVPPVAAEPSFIDDNPMLVYGGGGVLALLLGYLGFSAWRRKTGGGGDVSTVSRLSEGDLMANSVFGSTGGQAVDTSASIQTDFSQASLSAIDTDEGVDPVAEADVYMAYGRDAQAEEILVEALKTDPTRLAIYLKLLEIYSGHKNLSKFEKVATDLQGQTGGSGAEWDKAAVMGRAIDPGNPLYAGSGEAAIQPEVVVPDVTAPLVDEPPAASTPELLKDTVTLPGQLSQLAEAVPVEEPGAPTNLGFDLDLGRTPLTDEGLAPVSSATVQTHEIDLSLPEVGAIGESAQTTTQADSASGLDFEFDLDAPAAEVSDSAIAAAAPIDFSGINLDLVTATAPAIEMTEAAALDGDNADVTTKLELAQAYEEMGDREGARELLEEVLQEGSARQQEVARAKLTALDA